MRGRLELKGTPNEAKRYPKAVADNPHSKTLPRLRSPAGFRESGPLALKGMRTRLEKL